MNAFSLGREKSSWKRIDSLQCSCAETVTARRADGSDLVRSVSLETVVTKASQPERQHVAESMLMQGRTWLCISECHYRVQLLTSATSVGNNPVRAVMVTRCNIWVAHSHYFIVDYEVHNLAWQAAETDWEGKTPKEIFPWNDNDTKEKAQPVFTVGG